MATHTVDVLSFEEQAVANEIRVQAHAPSRVRKFVQETSAHLPLALEKGHRWHVCHVPSPGKRVVVYHIEDCFYHEQCFRLIGKSHGTAEIHVLIPESANAFLETIGEALTKV